MITAEMILKNNARDIISVSEEASLHEVLNLMVNNKIGAVSVLRNRKIIGLWTERDLLRNVLAVDLDLKKTKACDVMMSTLYMAPHTATLHELQDKFIGLNIRHLFIEKKGEIIGLISSGDVINAGLNLKNEELKNLHQLSTFSTNESRMVSKKHQRV